MFLNSLILNLTKFSLCSYRAFQGAKMRVINPPEDKIAERFYS